VGFPRKEWLASIWVLTLTLTICACGLLTNRQVAYLQRGINHVTMEEVATEFGEPAVERAVEDGGTVRVYRYTGVSMAMMMDVNEVWCVEYELTFDSARVLRHWVRRDCQPM
jgi:hypothetical protein